MLRASKNSTTGVASHQFDDTKETKEALETALNQQTDTEVAEEVIPAKETKQKTFHRRLGVVTAVLIYLVAAGGIASHYITSNYNEKLESKYKQYGSDKKPCAVIIPGLDGSTSFFKEIIPELTVNFNVLMFHLPLRPAATPQVEYTLQYIASELGNVLDELNIKRSFLIGESFGGVVAQVFTTQYPSRVDGLILLSSKAKTILSPEMKWKLENLIPILEAFGKFFPSLAQKLFANLHVRDVYSKNDTQVVKDLYLDEVSDAHFHSVMSRIHLVKDLNIIEQAKNLTTPTLILHGTDDLVTKESSAELHSSIPSSTLQALTGGHLTHMTNPKDFSKCVTDFLLHITPPADIANLQQHTQMYGDM